MPQAKFRESVPANDSINIDLSPNDRFGAQGGKLELFAVTTADGTHRITLMVGTDVIMDRGYPNVATAAGVVDNQRDKLAEGFGAPLDPITLRVENTTGAAAIIQGLVNFL